MDVSDSVSVITYLEAWQKVLDSTEGHEIGSFSVQFDGTNSWTYVRCTCQAESFREPWEFTDHLRRLVFKAVVGAEP